MNEPLILLITGIFFLLVLYFLLHPRKGIIIMWKKTKSVQKKALIEDALKYLYNCEYNNINCTLTGIAGNLSITPDLATEIVVKLETMGLVILKDDALILSDEGRSYALRVIRVHRLWEKYLAEKTSVKETEWHKEAEEIEHYLTPEQADILAAQIGNPVFDPHGDPIPSSAGVIPEKTGISLNEMEPAEFALITHIEDEPHAIYTQIVAEGLFPGVQIRMIEKSDKRIKFIANGEECVLSPLIAKNITVGTSRLNKHFPGKFKPLSALKIGEKGKVLGIAKQLRGQQRRRLMDLGIVPGTEIEAELESVSRDPVAYKILGASIALRKQQADKIFLVSDEESK